jgi:hypothetical protein
MKQNLARAFLSLLIAPGLCLSLAVPAMGGEPIQFSATHNFKVDENHASPAGENPDHVLGLY